jgi:diacylglycerol kinase family enzyme
MSSARPVLLINPESGEGRAEELDLRTEAEGRGIRAVELRPGEGLEDAARAAIADGASAIAAAGGDGSQGTVAGLAVEHDLPYACIPAGTRNHFALDLGIDRDDPVGALDALLGDEERRVDVGEVNGRAFVNNATLGVYAEAVSRDEYRQSKFRTVLTAAREALGNDDEAPQLRWTGPDGEQRRSILLLISNNPYRLSAMFSAGSRPRLDEGQLGVIDVRAPGGEERRAPWRQLTVPSFEVDADEPVAVAIDGDPATLEPPLRFKSRPGALRVRVVPDR